MLLLNMGIASAPSFLFLSHTEIFFTEIPCKIRGNQTVDFGTIDIALQLTLVTVPMKIRNSVVQHLPCFLHFLYG